MKITAEFNSVEELLNFTKTIGVQEFAPQQGMVQASIGAGPKEIEQEREPKVKETRGQDKTEIKEPVQIHSEENVEEVPKEGTKKDEPNITKEMVREKLSALMKAGKQKEVKELVAKFGASKVPDIKPEDYAAVYKEAEAL